MSINLENKWALVTGASSGLGRDFAIELAKRKCNLVIVARREDKLKALKQHIKHSDAVSVEVKPLDLTAPDAINNLHHWLQERKIHIDVLINNAGAGCYGNFLDVGWEEEHKMLNLDIVQVARLCKAFVPAMVAQRYGFVLNVASVAGFQPCPTYASYGAAKAYVLNFSEALAFELRKSGVRVSCLCPGPTATEFFNTAGQGDQLTFYQQRVMMDSLSVAQAGIRGLLRGKITIIPGLANKLSVFSLRFAPRRLVPWIANRLLRHNT